MQTTQELSQTRVQMVFAVVAGLLFCALHLLNGWLMGYFEFSDHINLGICLGF
jgi:hypothetical protein